jgi:hypothetical protein
MLKYRGLHVEFGPLAGSAPAPGTVRAPEAAISERQHNEITENTLAIEEIRLREEQLAQMLIENPLEAEKLLMAGETEEENDGREDD